MFVFIRTYLGLSEGTSDDLCSNSCTKAPIVGKSKSKLSSITRPHLGPGQSSALLQFLNWDEHFFFGTYFAK